MPEGHTIHRIARDHREHFAGQRLVVTSPQGRFLGGEALSGALLEDTEAYGKHLLYRFEGSRWIHIHLGLFGKVFTAARPEHAPRPTVRLRLVGINWFSDLVGPTRCGVIDPLVRSELFARLGPDPLRADADPERAWARISASRQPIAALLMDQAVVAGIGNVYRAELLFRARIDPYREGREVSKSEWDAMWHDLRTLMRAGVKANRIVTTLPKHRSRPIGRVRPDDAVYVYRRHRLPCRVCGTTVLMAELNTRRLYWCPSCQSR